MISRHVVKIFLVRSIFFHSNSDDSADFPESENKFKITINQLQMQ